MLSPLTQKFILFLTLPLVLLAFFFLSNIQNTLYENALTQLKGHMLELVKHQASEITGQLDRATAIAETTANAAGIAYNPSEKNIFKMLDSNLHQLPVIYGSALAFEPYRYQGKRLFAPYSYRKDNTIKHIDIAKSAYNYTDKQWQWWHGPRDLGKGIWTTPYFDSGAGDTLMVTYATPFYHNKKFLGVSTVDIDLKQLQQTLQLDSLKDIQYIILTNTGHFAYHYKKSMIGQSYIALADKLHLQKALILGKEMIAGESGFYEFEHDDKKEWIFFAPIGHYGWSFAIRSSQKEANALVKSKTENTSLWALVLIILALALTHLVSKSTIVKPLDKLKSALKALNANTVAPLQSLAASSPLKDLISLILQYHYKQEKALKEKAEETTLLAQEINEKNIQLKQSEQRLKSFIDAAQNPTIQISKAGEILLVNEKFKALLQRADFHKTSIISLINEASKTTLSQSLATLFQELSPQEISEIKLDLPNGASLSCEAILSPVIMEEDEVEASIIFLTKANR